MDTLLRIVWYVVIGGILLLANVWFISSLVSLSSRSIVIAPLRVAGKEDKDDKLATALALLLQARLNKINSDLEISQKALMESSGSAAGKKRVQVWGLPSQIFAEQKVDLKTRLLEPVNIDVAVGGVQVGGFFNWLQRTLSRQYRLDFAVYYQGESALVAGSIEPFTGTPGDPLWIKIEKATDEEIAANIAYFMLHKKLAKDPSNKLEKLEPADFRMLLDTLVDVAAHNKGLPAEKSYAELLPDMAQLVEKSPGWYELIHLTAGIAESAEDSRALGYYQQLEKLAADPSAGLRIDPTVRQEVQSKIRELQDLAAGAVNEEEREALKKIREDAEYAVSVLNPLFGLNLAAPDVVLLPKDERNAYWEPRDNKFHVPVQVKNLPDVTYHEVSHPFLDKIFPLELERQQVQQAAILESSADVLAVIVKQRRKQEASDADWVIAPGAVAWIQGDDPSKSPNRSPLRSLKDPGNAYRDEPLLGTDHQVASFDQVEATAELENHFRYSGIPSKAFYEMATQIGTDKAIKIWLDSLRRLAKERHKDFPSFATLTSQVASERFGRGSVELKAVEAAWEMVRVPKREAMAAKAIKSAVRKVKPSRAPQGDIGDRAR